MLAYPSLSQTRNHQTWKQRPDRSVETGVERPSKRFRLTKQNLRAFEKMGGQGRKSAGKKSTGRSSSITNYEDLGPQRHSRKSSYSETKSTRSKQTISSIDLAFPDVAFQNRIINLICSKTPVNLKYRQERIDRSRSAPSPSESDYRHFAFAIRRAST